MRLLLAVITLGSAALGPAVATGSQSFPYTAYINTQDVYVRSGPGEEYYPTDKLNVGQEVEVYRHDPGGWYAIRPPEGSFTWVSGRYLDPPKERLAAVNADRVAARVGSRFSDVRDVIQVRLHKGEIIEVLDSKTSSDRSGEKTTWYKIAPPSGEFRWVFGKYVDPQYPRDGVRKPHAAHTATQVAATTADAAIAGAHFAAPAGSSAAAAHKAESPSTAAQAAVAENAAETADGERPISVPAAMRHLAPEQFQAELDDIDMELSIMLAEEPTVWTFDQLQPRAGALPDQAQTALERGRARILVNKIARFEDIKQRYDAVNNLHGEVERRNRQLANLSRTRGEAGRAAESDDRFDGTGRLIRVVSAATGAPRYALVDSSGDVRCYVSPAPGVNLQHYVGHEVGVHGVRGYMPEQRAHHVMAKHVTLIDQSQLR